MKDKFISSRSYETYMIQEVIGLRGDNLSHNDSSFRAQ